jgi:glutamyl-Q tRNA(Asp) synthetase
MPRNTERETPRNSSIARGRFAPSPTGALHFGSLVAALASYLDAKSRGGEWLLRIEDLDPLREAPGATDAILRTLDHYGLHWDRPPVYQSKRIDHYRQALDRLIHAGMVYPCACSRREIADSGLMGLDAPVYPGTCRAGLGAGRSPRTWRLRVDDIVVVFNDEVQGEQRQNLQEEIGDFVLKRADGLFAYQLAVVIDDAHQGITRVTRGADLLSSSARQIYLQRCLELPTPAYLHIPAAVNDAGEKLSKQTFAAPISDEKAGVTLVNALRFLGQDVPAELAQSSPRTILEYALARWDVRRIPRQLTRPVG